MGTYARSPDGVRSAVARHEKASTRPERLPTWIQSPRRIDWSTWKSTPAPTLARAFCMARPRTAVTTVEVAAMESGGSPAVWSTAIAMSPMMATCVRSRMRSGTAKRVRASTMSKRIIPATPAAAVVTSPRLQRWSAAATVSRPASSKPAATRWTRGAAPSA